MIIREMSVRYCENGCSFAMALNLVPVANLGHVWELHLISFGSEMLGAWGTCDFLGRTETDSLVVDLC